MPAIIFPHLGFATAEGTILRWEKTTGESVQKGEALVEMASEKAIHVVASPASGVLSAVYAPPGAIVPEGEPLGWVGQAGEQAPEMDRNWLGWEAEIAPAPDNLADFLKPDSRVEENAADFGPPEKVDKAFRGFLKGQLRETTAKRMAKSWVDAPKVDLFAEVDFSRVVAHREAIKASGGQAPTFNVYIVNAVVQAFKEHPHLNLNWINGGPKPLNGIHVGVAVALEENLLTISLKNLDDLSLRDIERSYKGLIRKAVGMSLQRDELYGSSLTVTNLGEFEIFGFTPVINPPEIFILGIGELVVRPVVRDGAITTAPICYFCLSFDHRGVDGAPASRLLRSIKHHIEQFVNED